MCLIWFDTPRMMTQERGQRFVDIVHTLQPATLIDGRLGPTRRATTARWATTRFPNQVVTGDWEVPATLNHTWGFKKDDTDWKSPEDLTFKLVDIASKGGNYLLNVGPTSEGVIPQASQDNLRAVGRWLKVNGEAIYGAGPTPFGDELGHARQHATGQERAIRRSHATTDWRCTTKPGKLYIHLLQMAERDVRSFEGEGQGEEGPSARRRGEEIAEGDAEERHGHGRAARDGAGTDRLGGGDGNEQLTTRRDHIASIPTGQL